MRTDETDTEIAVQPETEVEQALLAEMFTRLTNVSDAPAHPDKVGDLLVYYTLDVPEYDGLDHDLWEEAECGVNEHGQLDPEPGSRALVVVHAGPEALEEVQPESDVDEGNHATEEDIEEAVEAVAEADDGGNEYTTTPEDVAREIGEMEPLEDVEYQHLQGLAKDASTTGLMDIPANQSTDDLIEDLRAFFDLTEVSA